MYKVVIFISATSTILMAFLFFRVGLGYVALRRKEILTSTVRTSFEDHVQKIGLFAFTLVIVAMLCEGYLAIYH
jgi:hypothetical protein